MRFLPTELPGVLLIEPDVHRDARGYFLETYQEPRYREGGVDVRFVQDNCSLSTRGTLRGLHAQRKYPQAKLLRVVSGEIFDVAVDTRLGSPNFGRWYATVLSAENFRQLYVPAGFAHGFCVLSETAELAYKASDVYHADDEFAVRWDDPQIGIEWPIDKPLLSPRDQAAPLLAELGHDLPRFEDWS